MDDESLVLAEGLVKGSYVRQGGEGYKRRRKLVKSLLSQRRLPAEGWDEKQVELFLAQVALLDTNNFVGHAGAGEREGRVYSDIVRRRHFGMSHGIGRSGDISAHQPKGAGGSLLQSVCHFLAADALRLSGSPSLSSCVVVPMATGMALSMVFMWLRKCRPGATCVFWPRIDQKTCLKAQIYSDLEPVIVPQIKEEDGDAVQSNPEWIRHALMDEDGDFFHRKDHILCILATTACFAPRVPDDIPSLAVIARDAGIPLVVNNAYGVQSATIMKSIERACKIGRVDAVVQSTDKNFMVPVGGAVIASPSAESIEAMSKLYPGRANSAPVVDLMITLLAMGAKGWKEVLNHRSRLLPELKARLSDVANEFGERLLSVDGNDVSIAMTLDTFNHPSAIGSALFHRNITGTRTFVAKAKLPEGRKPTSVGGFQFAEYGSHIDGYPHSYLNVACAIGLEEVCTWGTHSLTFAMTIVSECLSFFFLLSSFLFLLSSFFFPLSSFLFLLLCA
eukprot:TRINITY_DN1360_c0_g2_i2.p1 TRINITY_DN1360_c0_g2~~TRINITY_DN1360_c0_g2_i2.p1  ORF type:complete len:566 (+),score=119.59 TRINITY_DN1360_c0_g2_i2:185-1699(+)